MKERRRSSPIPLMVGSLILAGAGSWAINDGWSSLLEINRTKVQVVLETYPNLTDEMVAAEVYGIDEAAQVLESNVPRREFKEALDRKYEILTVSRLIEIASGGVCALFGAFGFGFSTLELVLRQILKRRQTI